MIDSLINTNCEQQRKKSIISASLRTFSATRMPFSLPPLSPPSTKIVKPIVFLMCRLHAHCALGGTNAGVMKHVGEAVKEQAITFGSEDKVNVIGIATWGIVDRKDSLTSKVG